MTEDTIDRFLDAFLGGDADKAMSPEFEGLAADVALAYIESGCSAKNPPAKVKEGGESALLDVIMDNAYPGESLELSLSRVARAAGVLGFTVLSAFSASVTYKIFTQLTERPYGSRKSTGKDSGGERRERAGAAECSVEGGGVEGVRGGRPQRR